MRASRFAVPPINSLIVQMARKLVLIAAAPVALACGGDSMSPSSGPPAHLAAGTDLNRTTVVGATIPAGLVVTVTDASGRAVAGAPVAFAVTGGNGSTNPRIATTGSNGQATAAWTLGTIAGDNVITASVSGAGGSVTFHAMGTPGPTATLSLSPQSVRMPVNVDSARISAASLDMFGNATTPAPVLVARDPTLISLDATGLVHALRRGSATWVVATSGVKSDSVLVTVLAVGQSLCTGAAPPVDIPVGQVITAVSGDGFCVHGSSPGAEYAIIPYYNSGVASATAILEVRGQGITPLSLPSPEVFSAAHARGVARAQEPPITIDHTFENRLRERARGEAARRLGGRGGWRASLDAARANATSAIPAVGDFISLNANANDFCDNPQPRIGRVAAVSNKAIVVADTSNPAGGFSDAEYQSIAVTFDTLVDPVDRAAFGTPSDIDGNGRVIMFFTRAVNELTSPGVARRDARLFLSAGSVSEDHGAGAVRGQQLRRDVLSPRSRHRGSGQPEQAVEVAGADAHQRHGGARVPTSHQRVASNVRERRGSGVRGALARRGTRARRRGAQLLPLGEPVAENQPRRDGIQRSDLHERLFRLRDQQFPPLQPVPGHDRDPVPDRFQPS